MHKFLVRLHTVFASLQKLVQALGVERTQSSNLWMMRSAIHSVSDPIYTPVAESSHVKLQLKSHNWCLQCAHFDLALVTDHLQLVSFPLTTYSSAFSKRFLRVGYLLGGVGWVPSDCRKLLQGVFERTWLTISRQLSVPLTTWLWEGWHLLTYQLPTYDLTTYDFCGRGWSLTLPSLRVLIFSYLMNDQAAQ